MDNLLDYATRFSFRKDLILEKRSSYLWAILDGPGGFVLAHDGEWEWEPQPSSRDEEFIERTRWNFDEALEKIKELMCL